MFSDNGSIDKGISFRARLRGWGNMTNKIHIFIGLEEMVKHFQLSNRLCLILNKVKVYVIAK